MSKAYTPVCNDACSYEFIGIQHIPGYRYEHHVVHSPVIRCGTHNVIFRPNTIDYNIKMEVEKQDGMVELFP